MRFVPVAAAATAALALLCPASLWAASPSAQVDYRCAKELTVRVLYDNSATSPAPADSSADGRAKPGRALAWVHHAGQTHRLALTRTASGTRYTDGRWSWWGKGGEARLDRQGRPAVGACRAVQTRRVLIDRRTRTQWLLPPGWSAASVREELSTGAAAEAEQPGAQLVARYSEPPAAPGDEARPLGQLMVFAAQRWDELGPEEQAAAGVLVSKTPTWTYVARVAAAPVTPERDDAMEQLHRGLQLWGQGPRMDHPLRPSAAPSRGRPKASITVHGREGEAP